MYESPPGNVTRQLLARALYFFVPSPCLECSRPVWQTRDALGLCPSCRERLLRWPERGCPRCGKIVPGTLPAGGCGACLERPPPFERLLAGWSYQPPVDTVLTALKFQRLGYLGGHVGRRLAEIFAPELGDCDVVVPVPLHWSRFLARGYNQAAAIARPLAAKSGLPIRRALVRRRPTPAQSRLKRAARRRNLRDAFTVRRPGLCRGRHVLLVDDVVTTGATLEAAARALCRAGARRVTALAAARTPSREELLHLPKR